MSYAERLGRMVYTAPSGRRFLLRFNAVSRELGKKAPVTEFPQRNAGAVQDLGQLTERYPVECFIDGQDYDLIADAFAAALQERGPGEIEHPRWGVIPVLPVSVSQTEQFIDGAGRATFSINFVRSEDEQFVYPRTSGVVTAAAQAAIDDAFADIVDSLDDFEITDPGALATFRDTVTGAVNTVAGTIDNITDITNDIRAQVDDVVREITGTIDTLVNAPGALANALLQLYRLPADIVTDTQAKINGYKQIFDTVVTSFANTTRQYGDLFGLFGASQAQAIAIATAEASLDFRFETRSSAIDSVGDLAGIASDSAEAVEGFGIEDYESQASSQRAMTLALESIIVGSINLPAERVTVLDEDLTPLELVYQLYGVDADVDMMLDRIVDYNQLSGSDIIVLRRGSEVRWYE